MRNLHLTDEDFRLKTLWLKDLYFLYIRVTIEFHQGWDAPSDQFALENARLSSSVSRDAGIFIYANSSTGSVRVLQYDDLKLANSRNGRAGLIADLQDLGVADLANFSEANFGLI